MPTQQGQDLGPSQNFTDMNTAEKKAPVLTRGQQVMSVQFNPGQREDVKVIKQIFADAFDTVDQWVDARVSGPAMLSSEQRGDILRLAAIAKTNLETAQMYAVKAVTR